ncbi:MAG: type II secretion system secretin GspD [Betaproteobacteria bacterium]|nr:type II secretion system secretin GspD [Betaproteobacteria bacterium]NCP80920.1 type II secretion system secretin GspD [Rhodoferax sp.]OIP19849.1 MAG: type II secretion system protein GspD [Comamonadaceae bacterium CG2_30_57_122]PIZ22181.1 MAG: type II secretion system protein GspD [Comamonadaceae bacterium CG_4_10_14_0_8_um_filter_57_29]PJC20526.1 MAG: type II secretion system protein GspD [Comamonadaceae bacterium CG_4_9_14_0_8_um_filter_57_21]
MQRHFFIPFKNTIISIAVCAMIAGAAGLFSLQAVAQSSGQVKASEAVTLNFQGAEIEAVARTFASITGRNVVVDPRVKGTLTLVADKPVSRAAALGQFVAALRLQGYTLVESGGLYKVVPEADAKLQSAGVTVQDGASAHLPGGNQIATQIFKLNFESANNLVPVLRPLISPNNTINANPGSNSLVITDYGDNLRRLASIIAALDVANATDVEVIPVQHAIASDLASLVLRLIGVSNTAAPAGAADAAFKTTLVAEPRTNALILRAANGAQLSLARALIQKLDQPETGSSNGAAGNIHVVYLKNADATKLAVTLRAAVSGNVATSPAPVAAAGAAVASNTTGGQIQADPATNSLIITAPEPQYRQLRAVIDRLDARRAQVFVESLIAEVSVDKAAEFGIQWQGALGQAGDGIIGLLGSNFGAGGKNIINLATAGANGVVSPARGLNIGAARRTNGVYVLGFLARFLEDSGSGNVLSTPNLLTLDNEEAKIVIGQQVPFVTGQFTNTGSNTNGTVNPFQTIERKDVGLTLKVKPQISENGTVKLAIYQEVSSVLASTVNAVNGPTTNKRTIESNVLVEDGNIVVLGGLLQDEYSGNAEKVPGLGDVPLFGNLFKSEARTRKKTNLMVFLRPVVVRDARDSDRLSLDRYDLMSAGLLANQPVPNNLVPINDSPTLPPAPASKPAASASAVPAPLVSPLITTEH